MRVYHERLRVPLSYWLLGTTSLLMLGAGLLAGINWEPALVVYLILGIPFAALLLHWGQLRLEVSRGELRVGRIRLPLGVAGEVVALDATQTTALRGPRADPAAFLVSRPYLPLAVYIAVQDPAATTPYWLIGTRRPAELAAAIEAARPAARADGASVA